jgi:hypothetical protein
MLESSTFALFRTFARFCSLFERVLSPFASPWVILDKSEVKTMSNPSHSLLIKVDVG